MNTNDSQEEWWERLRRRFKDMRVSQTQLARELDVSKQLVSMWFAGEREPPLKTIRWLCERAELDWAQLMSSSPYWVSSPIEREIIDAVRQMSPAEREAYALIGKRKT